MSLSDSPGYSGILVIDKPDGLTSHDVVSRVRRTLGMKHVGHGGTLDPFATGVLPIAVGPATRMLRYVQSSNKGYRVEIVLGVETDSGDVDGAVVDRRNPVSWPAPDDVLEVCRSFAGIQTQIPPALSAIKVGGQPLHRRVRAGESVVPPARTIMIHSIKVLEFSPPALRVAVACGSGAYMRSLARDIGRALGTLAYCRALRRTNTGPFCLGDAWTLDELAAHKLPEAWPRLALSMDAAAPELDAIVLGEEATIRWYHGRPLAIGLDQRAPAGALLRVYDQFGRFAGIGHIEPSGEILPRLVVPRTEEEHDA